MLYLAVQMKGHNPWVLTCWSKAKTATQCQPRCPRKVRTRLAQHLAVTSSTPDRAHWCAWWNYGYHRWFSLLHTQGKHGACPDVVLLVLWPVLPPSPCHLFFLEQNLGINCFFLSCRWLLKISAAHAVSLHTNLASFACKEIEISSLRAYFRSKNLI